MTINFMILIFTWLLSGTASSEVTRKNFIHDQLTSQKMFSSYPGSKVSDHTATPSVMVGANVSEGKTTTTASLQTTQTMPPTKILMNTQTTATPTDSRFGSTGIRSTTEEQSKVIKSTTAGASQASNLTKPTRVPAVLGNFTQTQGTVETSTSQFVKDKTTHPSKQPPQTTNLISTATTSIKPEEDKSESTSTATDGDTAQPTGLYKTSVATSFIHTTTVKKRQNPSGKEENSKNRTHHSETVAGLIGGALILMMVGFLVIFIKKRKLRKQQITASEWAGPSPFLEGGADNERVALRSSTRISFASFLPQRLSKRLSMLPEVDKELEDMTLGTTFGGKHQESTFDRGVDGNDVQQSNDSAAVPETKSTLDTAETIENSVSVTPSQMNNTLSTNNHSDVANVSQDHSANLSDLSGAVENDHSPRNNGLGQL
ncbi:mucin-22 [Stegastes partitus]|uniref:Protein EVI2B n=1 Tax=Stegastes partitus TaxID=144197 RepID=A0A9Y4JFU8_9TELE|nr:PREDICTED: protein EVI2B [Stegastes partitus]XP_008274600.1 PREDICTED: protein EVI2B [Stegastes partitus]